MSNNTKAQSGLIFKTAASILEAAGGHPKIDALDLESRYPILNGMYADLMAQTGCVRETAKRNIAKALRKARYGTMVQRGGARPGAGRPRKAE